jgi:hypothetical protein
MLEREEQRQRELEAAKNWLRLKAERQSNYVTAPLILSAH